MAVIAILFEPLIIVSALVAHRYGHIAALSLLQEYGADCAAPSPSGDPLSLAKIHGDAEAVSFLLGVA